MRPRLPAVLAVLLGSLSLALPSAQAASFGTGDDRVTLDDSTYALPGSSCTGATTYAATVRRFLPAVTTSSGTVTYTLQGAPASLTLDSNRNLLEGTLAADLRQASAVSHTLTWTATDTAGSDSLTFKIEIVDERPALEALYTSTKGADWTTKTNWAADIPAATCLTGLHGVTLRSTTFTVWKLDLSSNNLTGSIPEKIEELHGLHTLNLSDNGLTGSIPEDLGHVHDLYVLDLSDNGLTGSIPEDVGHLHQLRTLDLSHNSLTGSIPEDFDSSAGFTHPGHLEQINLSHNRLTGSIPLFAQGAPHMTDINLSHNQLTGGLPSDLSSLGALDNLNLSHNQITGAIPAAFPKDLITLDLSHNQLAGAIPAALHSTFYTSGQRVRVRSQLIILDLSHNKLTGAIPTLNALSNGFQRLQSLDLSHNKLTGTITAPGFQLGFLTTFDVSHNQLTGSVPKFKDSFTLKTLDLSHNQLSGAIPAEITASGGFSVLEDLHLHNNNLSGEIPAILGTLDALKTLSLYNNPPPSSTSTAKLYNFPSSMNRLSNLQLLVPNTGHTMCLYGDAMGADGSTACAIPTRVDQLRLISVDESRSWDCTTWIAVEWKPMFTTAPTGYELQYRSTGATEWTSAQVNGTETFVAINGLTAGGSYEVRVRTSDSPARFEPDLRTPWLQTSINLSSDGDTD